MCCIERVCYVERKVAVAGGVEQRRVCTLSLVFCVLLGRATPRTRKEERSREILSAHWLQAALDSLVGPTRRLPHRQHRPRNGGSGRHIHISTSMTDRDLLSKQDSLLRSIGTTFGQGFSL